MNSRPGASPILTVTFTAVLLTAAVYPALPETATEAAAREDIPFQRLRNTMPTAALRRFKATVERQARDFPGLYFLEATGAGKKVALTFDDGPDYRYTKQVLDIANKAEIKITFFYLGQQMRRYPAIVRQTLTQGHAVGLHSYDHPDFRKLDTEEAFKDQVQSNIDAFRDIAGCQPSIFRPPYGAVTDEQIRFFWARGLRIINWSVDTFDWDSTANSVESILDRVTTLVHEGAIILMHSAGGNRSTTVKSLPAIIERLKQEGYTFCTVPDILGINPYLEVAHE